MGEIAADEKTTRGEPEQQGTQAIPAESSRGTDQPASPASGEVPEGQPVTTPAATSTPILTGQGTGYQGYPPWAGPWRQALFNACFLQVHDLALPCDRRSPRTPAARRTHGCGPLAEKC